jgi:hypothetical protein
MRETMQEQGRDERTTAAIFEAVRRYGSVTREEAVDRVGDQAAEHAISRLVAAKLLVNLTEQADSPREEVFAMSDRAEELLEEGISIKRLVALALADRSSRLIEHRGLTRYSAGATKFHR